MKTALLNTAIWFLRRFLAAWIEGGVFERVENLFNLYTQPQYRNLSGETKRKRVVEAMTAELGELKSALGVSTESVVVGVIQLLYLRLKTGGKV